LAPATAISSASEANVCGSRPSEACQLRVSTLRRLHDQGNSQANDAVATARELSNSLIFNAFIASQVPDVLADKARGV
jgi:hypothetical protein